MALIFGESLFFRFDQNILKHGQTDIFKIIIFSTSVYSNVLEMTELRYREGEKIQEKWKC